MTDSINIAAAQEQDLPAITALIVELSDEANGPNATDQQMIEKNVSILFRDGAARFLVARSADHVVGFANFTTRRTIMHSSESGLVDELIVSREYRGKGVGKRLISEVIDQCRELGCCELEVSTMVSNKNAREFYKGCGFADEAVLLEMDLVD
ncbi:MAG: GNAT family N-acetyltransferase [Planctomycetota bacterium]|jgi:GNAT superfamily N-acetyltransferase